MSDTKILKFGGSSIANAEKGGFFRKKSPLNIYIAGTGTVGKSLVKILDNYCEKHPELNIRPGGLINSRFTCLNETDNSFKDCLNTLLKSENKYDENVYLAKMLASHHAVFIDCSSGGNWANHYETILSKGISIVTANKVALSSDITDRRKLFNIAERSGAELRYEANVGAGLPIISTIQDLVAAGDNIHKIEGLFSGSLSYIFNTVDNTNPFSKVVKNAIELGYMEADPRDDLDGLDMARKALILHREIGGKLNLEDIEQEAILPENIMNAEDVESFIRKLSGFDSTFKNALNLAADVQKKLRYLAKITKESIKISIEAVDNPSPFYHLSNMDNCISIASDFYSIRPMIIQGAGAGADVTASGVFADFLKILKSF
ncbi:MAG: hypothetical protein KAI81_08130 [Candidatus Marinimicrobia bacterium]|nr:hypothetical protein [Candidatus Neomarinimicrobiota bacterium]